MIVYTHTRSDRTVHIFSRFIKNFLPAHFALPLKKVVFFFPIFVDEPYCITFQLLFAFPCQYFLALFPDMCNPIHSFSNLLFQKFLTLPNLHPLLPTVPSLGISLESQLRSVASITMLLSPFSSTCTWTQLEWVPARCSGTQIIQLALCSTRCTTTPSTAIMAWAPCHFYSIYCGEVEVSCASMHVSNSWCWAVHIDAFVLRWDIGMRRWSNGLCYPLEKPQQPPSLPPSLKQEEKLETIKINDDDDAYVDICSLNTTAHISKDV